MSNVIDMAEVFKREQVKNRQPSVVAFNDAFMFCSRETQMFVRRDMARLNDILARKGIQVVDAEKLT